MEEAKISSKGQIVIPKYLRDALGMEPGKSVMIVKEENKLVLFAKPDDPLKGLVDTGKEISMKNIRREIKGE
jgi:AbrB family looped-hinge helix DNA binding protein